MEVKIETTPTAMTNIETARLCAQLRFRQSCRQLVGSLHLVLLQQVRVRLAYLLRCRLPVSLSSGRRSGGERVFS